MHDLRVVHSSAMGRERTASTHQWRSRLATRPINKMQPFITSIAIQVLRGTLMARVPGIRSAQVDLDHLAAAYEPSVADPDTTRVDMGVRIDVVMGSHISGTSMSIPISARRDASPDSSAGP
jgi:hypothetical protein